MAMREFESYQRSLSELVIRIRGLTDHGDLLTLTMDQPGVERAQALMTRGLES